MIFRICFLLCSALWVGCLGSANSGRPEVGEEGGPCNPAGDCFGDLTCASNICVSVPDSSCTGVTCVAANADCGEMLNGCGAIINCGECQEGQTCGAAGLNICGDGNCVPTTCGQEDAECGVLSDGCGAVLQCGECPSGQTCGVTAPNLCSEDNETVSLDAGVHTPNETVSHDAGVDTPNVSPDDTDGDGYTNAEEQAGNTDPNDAQDHPYAGGWPIADCGYNIVPTGYDVGQVASDFSLLDQNGDMVNLYSFCDKVVLLASTAAWCSVCSAAAVQLEDLYQTYKNDGLMVISLYYSTMNQGEPIQSDLADWADNFNITFPVLADLEPVYWSRFGAFGTNTQILLGRGAEVLKVNGVFASDIEAALILCGNGIVENGEQCDGTNLNSATCVSLGYGIGELGCTGQCQFDISSCTGPICGNGIIENGEQCDDNNAITEETCPIGCGELSCEVCDETCHLVERQVAHLDNYVTLGFGAVSVGSVEITITSGVPISGGFQFDFSGADILSHSDGILTGCDGWGIGINTQYADVLGLKYADGNPILPVASEHVLTVLSVGPAFESNFCISGAVFSDEDANEIPSNPSGNSVECVPAP